MASVTCSDKINRHIIQEFARVITQLIIYKTMLTHAHMYYVLINYVKKCRIKLSATSNYSKIFHLLI